CTVCAFLPAGGKMSFCPAFLMLLAQPKLRMRAAEETRDVPSASSLRLAARRTQASLFSSGLLILALGIGVNTAMFSVLNTLLFHAVPYRDAERILALYQANPGRGLRHQLVSIPDYFDWRRENQAFDGLAAWNFQYFTLSGASQPERVQGLKVTADF